MEDQVDHQLVALLIQLVQAPVVHRGEFSAKTLQRSSLLLCFYISCSPRVCVVLVQGANDTFFLAKFHLRAFSRVERLEGK